MVGGPIIRPHQRLLTFRIGYGIINATGDLWRAQRKAGVKFFSAANLDTLIEHVLPGVYHDSTKKQLLHAAKDGTVVDLQKVLLDLTTTVVGHMAYDVCSTTSKPEDTFRLTFLTST